LETRIAKIISYLFHPLLMPTYGFILIFATTNYISTFTPSALKLAIIGITFMFTFVLPTLNAFILLKTGRIQSLEMESSSERVLPYISTILYFAALFYMFYVREFPTVLVLLIAGAGLSILATFIINFFWKISAHAIGIGGIVGALIGIYLRLQIDLRLHLLVVIFVAGLVGFARLKLKAHSPGQVYSGYALGALVMLSLMILF
jgi:hypothetical protein